MTTENRERTVAAYFEQMTEDSFSTLVQNARLHAVRLFKTRPPELVSAAVHEFLIKQGYPKEYIVRDLDVPYRIIIKDKHGRDRCIFDVSTTDLRIEQLKEKSSAVFDASAQGFLRDPEQCFKEIQLIVEGLEVRGWSYESIKEFIILIIETYCPQVILKFTDDFDIDAVHGNRVTRLYNNFVKDVAMTKPKTQNLDSEISLFEATALL